MLLSAHKLCYIKRRKMFRATPRGASQGLQFPWDQAHAEITGARLMHDKTTRRCDQGRA